MPSIVYGQNSVSGRVHYLTNQTSFKQLFTQNKRIYVLLPSFLISDLFILSASHLTGVIIRYAEGANGVADLSTEFYLLGNKKDQQGYELGFMSCDPAHHTGGLAIGMDGTLFAASGDGAK